ncbi:MAG: Sensor protein QseC [uncultured marine phage]|uniref:histidine kinase n=1 Tax=uncultured marine phage TaxID=707152 RepID=A0A8D9FRZ3_9VIRU|nr:MAG: Sensor protein QseC [uncultured marine phage]
MNLKFRKLNLLFDGVSMKSKICMVISVLAILVFLVAETILTFEMVEGKFLYFMGVIGYACVIAFIIPFIVVVKEFIKNKSTIIEELKNKNTYLEHSAKILRHDMHSGINTYLPRGIRSLERRLTPKHIEELKLESPMKMLKEGLKHTQKVYKGVFEFTNLVKKDAVMSKEKLNVKDVLDEYLSSTSYKSQVLLDNTISFELEINESLFCTAIDNLIRNGLKYNDSDSKVVKIYREGNFIIVEDNGRGMSKEEYNFLSQPYVRKDGQKESGSGLGLNICSSIMKEHKFSIRAQKISGGPAEFYKRLEEIQKRYEEKPNIFAFDRSSLEELAKECNYQGKLRTKRGGRNRSKIYVFFEEGKQANKGTKIKIKIK